MTSILTIAQDACDELSLATPSTLIDNDVDDTARKMLRMITRTCRQLAARYDWQSLRREHTFTTVATADQAASVPIPTDFLRFVPDSMFNRDKTWRVVGPLSGAEWQAHQATLTTRVFPSYSMRGGTILMAPTPAAGETVAYEYITKYIGTDTTGVTDRTSFTVDTDLVTLDDELVMLGVIWRYRKAEGQDYAEEFREYELRINDLIKIQEGRKLYDMSSGGPERVPMAPRVPDTLTGLV